MRYLFSLPILALSACATPASDPSAVAVLQPTIGNSVTGTVTFKQLGDSVLVTGPISRLRPNRNPDFTSTKGAIVGGVWYGLGRYSIQT
jgi:Cu-Zn family superoxide dismutase